jgi:hypothetical protein
LAWRKPEDFADINRRVRKFHEQEAEEMAKPKPIFTTKELKTLVSYATPYEKLILLLGLNCGFQQDMLGRIKPKHLSRTKKGNYILKLVRPKRKTWSMHKLWPEVVEGLKWQIERRPVGSEDFVFVALQGKRKGQQLYRKTKGGNISRKFAKIWDTLIARVKAADPNFRKSKPCSFGFIRKTSANEVHQIAGGEIASLHTAHGTQYKHDASLHHYVNPDVKTHFAAIDQMRHKWLDIVTGGPEWESEIGRACHIGPDQPATASLINSMRASPISSVRDA